MRQSMVLGLDVQDKDSAPDPICEPCLAGKLHRGPIPKTATHRASRPLELVHSDVHGPLPVATRQGWRYWVSFICDSSRYWAVIPLSHKSGVFDTFKRFQAAAERGQLN